LRHASQAEAAVICPPLMPPSAADHVDVIHFRCPNYARPDATALLLVAPTSSIFLASVPRQLFNITSFVLLSDRGAP
jgi:hypothetical protein